MAVPARISLEDLCPTRPFRRDGQLYRSTLGRTENWPFHRYASRTVSKERSLKKSSKPQAPSSREAPNINIQVGFRSRPFGAWKLMFLWSLVFGAWSFITSAQTLQL